MYDDTEITEFNATILDEESLARFRQECLDQHNFYRSQHGALAMTLDDGLNEAGQTYVV